jgi:hypothetical protein
MQALSLPRVIKQDDGSRDLCVRVFNEMDTNSSGEIDRKKFLSYLDRKKNGQEITPNVETKPQTPLHVESSSTSPPQSPTHSSQISDIEDEESDNSQDSDSEPNHSENEQESMRTETLNVLDSHPQSNLFSLIDRDSNGKLTSIEFIQALRTQPAVLKVCVEMSSPELS